MDAVADHLDDAPAPGRRREELGHRSGGAVVHGAHAVEQVGGGGAVAAHRQPRVRARVQAGGGVGQGGAHGAGLGVGVAQARQGAAGDEGRDDAVVAGDAGLLGGDGHGGHVAAAQGDQLADQVRIGVDDVGGVLGAAALDGDEGPLEVDGGELSALAQVGQHRGALAQDLGGGGDAGGHEAGGAGAAVLHDGRHGLLGGLGVGEGLAAAAVAVDVDQAGQDVAAPGGLLRLLDDVSEAGPGGPVRGPDPRDVGSRQDDRSVIDDAVGGDDTTPQCADPHGFAAHELDSVTSPDIRQPCSRRLLPHIPVRSGSAALPPSRCARGARAPVTGPRRRRRCAAPR